MQFLRPRHPACAEGLEFLDPAPDFLIPDLSLPDGGGEAILRQVRDNNLKTRAAIMTGVDDAARLRTVKEMDPEAPFEEPINIVDVWHESEQARNV